MKAQQRMIVGLAISFGMSVVLPSAHARCKSVQGHIVSELVGEFSDGTPCPSSLGLCTEGRFTGSLKGDFTFVAESLTPYASLDSSAPGDVAATTGLVTLHSKICDGTLMLQDTSTFSIAADGTVGGIETVDGDASSGDCWNASGRMSYMGIFDAGCVDCKYKGEVCLDGNGDIGEEADD